MLCGKLQPGVRAVVDKAGDAAMHKGQQMASDAVKGAGAKFAGEKVLEEGGQKMAGEAMTRGGEALKSTGESVVEDAARKENEKREKSDDSKKE